MKEDKILNDAWAHQAVLFFIKMRFEALRFQVFALILIFLKPAHVALMCFALGTHLMWVTNTSNRKKQNQ